MESENQLKYLMSVCRLCKNKNNDMESIFQAFHDDKTKTVHDILMEVCYKLEISQHDGLSEKICEICKEKLINSYDFQIMCMKTQVELKKTLKSLVFCKQELDHDDDHFQDDYEEKGQDFEEINIPLLLDTIIKEEPEGEAAVNLPKQETYDHILVPKKKRATKKEKSVAKPRIRKSLKRSCPICGIPIKDVNKHILNSHKDVKKDMIKCPYCPKEFYQEQSLFHHIKTLHGVDNENSEYICGVCDKIFAKRRLLTKHMVFHRVYIRCPNCKLEMRKNFMESHIKNECTKNVNICDLCGMTFTSKTMLYRHTIDTHQSSLVCNTCGRVLSSRKSLRAHELTHATNRKYPCQLCPSQYTSGYQLKLHIMKSHDKTARFVCDICGSTYRDKSSIVKHLQKHAKNYRFACVICGKQFYAKYDLTRHLPTHSRERRYRCELCGKQYMSQGDLYKHKRQHLGDKMYQCEQCLEYFKYQKDYKAHLTAHFLNDKKSQEAQALHQQQHLQPTQNNEISLNQMFLQQQLS